MVSCDRHLRKSKSFVGDSVDAQVRLAIRCQAGRAANSHGRTPASLSTSCPFDNRFRRRFYEPVTDMAVGQKVNGLSGVVFYLFA
jgi:hypothetical protein